MSEEKLKELIERKKKCVEEKKIRKEERWKGSKIILSRGLVESEEESIRIDDEDKEEEIVGLGWDWRGFERKIGS